MHFSFNRLEESEAKSVDAASFISKIASLISDLDVIIAAANSDVRSLMRSAFTTSKGRENISFIDLKSDYVVALVHNSKMIEQEIDRVIQRDSVLFAEWKEIAGLA